MRAHIRIMVLLVTASVGFGASQACGALLWSDNFNVADTTNFDGAPTAGRLSGSLAGDVVARSARAQQHIAASQLSMVSAGSGRVRFEPSPGGAGLWYDWAAGAGAGAILADGGLRVEFDTTTNDTTTSDWVSFNIGHQGRSAGEPATRVNHAETDYGILFRGNGGTQRFDNGAATTVTGIPATASQKHVVVDLAFSSFADGSTVSAVASVNGTQVDNYSFTWDNNAGELYWELGTNRTGMLVDNYSISTLTVPPLQNPGFESPDFGAGGWKYGSAMAQAELDAAKWTFGGGAGLSGPDGPWKADTTSPDPHGDQFAYLQGANATVSQSLAGLEIGKTYGLSFLESYRTAQAPSNDLTVVLDEGLATEATIYTNGDVSNRVWALRQTDRFVAEKDSYTLTFRTSNPLGTGDRSTLVDGVKLNADPHAPFVATQTNDWGAEIPAGEYSHALNFGGGGVSPTTVNGVDFEATGAGAFPGGKGNITYPQAWGGVDTNDIVGDNGLADKFIHSNQSQADLNLTGLYPREEYRLKLFSAKWTDTTDRTTVIDDLDAIGEEITFNPTEAGARSGMVVSYTYTAQDDGELNLSLGFATNQSPHLYALTNQVVPAGRVTIDPKSVGLFNTGAESSAGFDADTNGGIAAQVDDHWYIAGGPPGELQTNGPEAFILQDPHSDWMANSASPDSVWIAGRAAAQGIALGGDYQYRIDFDLMDADPDTVILAGRFAADNSVVINLNGEPTGVGGAGFSEWIPFVLDEGFVDGLNTLEFLTNNADTGPMALRVEFDSLRAAIPEPATIAMLSLAIGGLGLKLRRRRRK